MNPTISIIVPVYNVGYYLRNCLESILAQTFTDFEVIVVNDGSTDSSGVICDEFADQDNRIKVIHKDYGGVSSARNAGLNKANGDFIGFVDGDDKIETEMYEKLYKLCLETGSDISICKLGREIDGRLINPNLDKEAIIELSNEEAMRELFKGKLFRFSLCNKLFRKQCFSGVTFPEGRIHEDLSTTYKLFGNTGKSVYTSYIGYIYVKRSQSILTSQFSSKRLDAFIGWEEIFEYMNSKYKQLLKEVNKTFVYSCVDYIYYVLNQVHDYEKQKKYLLFIQSQLRKNLLNSVVNTKLSLKYKLIILMLCFNVNLFCNTRNLKLLISKA